MQILSLGAGVQSTALLIASANGLLPKLDAAIFSDTGWEPQDVYDHLDRLEEEIAKPAGIPIYRVSNGNIRADVLDPDRRGATMPLFVRKIDGGKGITRRQCTEEYKIKPIKRKVRELLGAEMLENGRPGRVPAGRQAVQWIGISTDEFHRAKDSDVKYVKHHFPLLMDLNWSRKDCEAYLKRHNFGDTRKSACLGCPFHGNRAWRDLRDNYPSEWADVVDFEQVLQENSKRNLSTRVIDGDLYLHRSLLPLSTAPIDKVTRKELQEAQTDIFDVLREDDEELFSCSPFSCKADEVDASVWVDLEEDISQ